MRTGCTTPSRIPRVLAILPGLIPSTLIHVVKPLVGLHRLGCISPRFTLEHNVSHRSLEQAEVVVLCRNTDPTYGWIADHALAQGKPVMYDLDDNFFELPLTTDVGRYHRAPERLRQLERYLSSASLVRVYSETLREHVERLNPSVVRVEGPIDWSLVPSRPKRQDLHKPRIVYPTSRVEDELAQLFLGDIRRLLAAYPGQLEVVFWGYHPPELRGHLGVRFIPPVASYDRFFRKFARFGFDVGLAPLRDDVFHRSKSDVKFREYAACGIAGVYSNVGPYAQRVRHEVTGLLVSNESGAWFDAVTRLLKDVNLRRAIQERAREYARKNYDLRSVEEVWCSQIHDVMANGIRGCRSFAAHRQSGAHSRLVLTKQILACWARRANKVVQTLRGSGFRRTVDKIRQSLSNPTMLLQVRIKLKVRSIFRWMLPRAASRTQLGLDVYLVQVHRHSSVNRSIIKD